MISHIVVLSNFYDRLHVVQLVVTVEFRFRHSPYMINHVIVLYGHRHRSYHVELDKIV